MFEIILFLKILTIIVLKKVSGLDISNNFKSRKLLGNLKIRRKRKNHEG